MTGGRGFRALVTSLLALAASLLLGTTRGHARELRDEAARFFMDVSVNGGDVCVVHPKGFTDEACRHVPPERFRMALTDRTTFYAVEFPDWEFLVFVTIDDNPARRALTAAEATEVFDANLKAGTSTNPGIKWASEMRRLERGDLQTYQRTAVVPTPDRGSYFDRLEIIAGSESLVTVNMSFTEAHAAAGNELADAIMSTVSLPAAPPLRTEVAYGALKLLAGVPIVAFFGLLRARTKSRAKK